VYRETDVNRLQELIRLRYLLGLSLEELIELAEAEEARGALRSRWETDVDDRERLNIIDAATPLVEQQLKLVRARRVALGKFAAELEQKLTEMRVHRDEIEARL
jgi:DNA-binding transcriptional MerR regulator